MTSSVENLILEHLKRFQAGQDRIEEELSIIKTRLSSIEEEKRGRSPFFLPYAISSLFSIRSSRSAR